MTTYAATADLRQLSADLAYAAGSGINQVSQALVLSYGQRIAQLAQAMAPVKTGRLRFSIRVQPLSPTAVKIGPDVDYDVFQEFGTGARGEFPGHPYVITPRRPGGRLVFQINGKWIATTRVVHPGIPAHPYMRPAFAEALQPFTKELADKGALLITQGSRGV